MTVATATVQLAGALAGIDRPLLREHSAKSVGGVLRTGRYLVSFPRAAAYPAPARRVREIGARLGAPEAGLERVMRDFAKATAVHFGYEPEGTTDVLKLYLEFAPEDAPAPDQGFLALKWRADGDCELSRYWRRSRLGHQAQRDLVEEIVPSGGPRDVLLGFLDRAADDANPQLLEVDDESGSRRSLDLNLYALGRTLGEEAEGLAAFLGVAEGQTFLSSHRDARLGHLALGLSRQGELFSTVYFGAHRVHGALD